MKQILFIIFIVIKTPAKFSEKLVWFKTLLRLEFFKSNKLKVWDLFLTANNYNSFRVLFKEIFIEKEYKFFTTQKQPIIFDCGANVGFPALFFKKEYPESKIICFEPSPNSYKILKANIRENNVTNIELFNVALTDYDGTIDFYVNDDYDLVSGTLVERSSGIIYECSAKKLSSYIKEYERIDLLKMDIEGAEMNVIKELEKENQLIKINQLIIEFHHNTGDSKLDLAEFLGIFSKHGFNYSLRSKYLKLGEFQDILIHFFRK